ncbi:6-bladed beta-propeller [Mucilaginibacter ximonensis]|uniref:6-bladed beta-propeller n=1 Tax=Mucilaginibacter ximonensis TaxID=538021 RepID=A0ABW5YDI1_9SPHI
MNPKPIVAKLIVSCCLLLGTVRYTTAQKIIPVDSSKAQILRIDPSNAMGGNASDFFTEVNYIPLETTDESLFGSINKLVVTDDYFIILDHNTRSILIFNKNGKFHTKIKGTDGAPIWDFSVNKFTKEIRYSRDQYKSYTYCDYNGKEIRNLKSGGELAKDEINDGNMRYFAADKGVSTGYPNTIDSTSKYYKPWSKSLIIFSNEKNKVYAHGLGFDKREGMDRNLITMGGILPMNTVSDTAFYYVRPYTFNVYTIKPDIIKLSYKLVFPFFVALPQDFVVNPVYDNKRVEYVQKHPKTIYYIANFFQLNDNLIFRAGSYEINDEDNLIYNLRTGTLIAYKHILQDEKSYFLPIYDNSNWGSSFNFNGLLACTDGYIYTSSSSLGMFQYHEKYADQKVKYPPALETYFKKGSRKDNPVIMQLKLKDNL